MNENISIETFWNKELSIDGNIALVDLEGACRAHATPYETQFFRFRIHYHRKAPVSEVHTP